MILLVLIVGWVVFAVLALALVGGARYTAPRSESIEPILRATPRERRPELDGGTR